MRWKFLVLLAVVLGVWTAAFAPPPPPPRHVPGNELGSVETRWIAPYVSATTRRVGESWFTSVAWLTPEGKVRREVAGNGVIVQPGYVYQREEGQAAQKVAKCYALNADWELTLPDKPESHIACSQDGRLLVRQFCPREGEIALDLYASGKLIASPGPFLQYLGNDGAVGSDSVALLSWKTAAKDLAQVVVIGMDGKECLRADCMGPVTGPIPAPGGAAVLLESNGGGKMGQTYSLYNGKGKVSSLNVGFNAHFSCWLPGTNTALMETSDKDGRQWHLIDWQTGKRLWETGDLSPARADWGSTTTLLTPDYALIGELEYDLARAPKVATRSVYALDMKTGKLAAHWLPNYRNPSGDIGSFLQLDQRLFLIASDIFSEINLNDIRRRAEGWQ